MSKEQGRNALAILQHIIEEGTYIGKKYIPLIESLVERAQNKANVPNGTIIPETEFSTSELPRTEGNYNSQFITELVDFFENLNFVPSTNYTLDFIFNHLAKMKKNNETMLSQVIESRQSRGLKCDPITEQSEMRLKIYIKNLKSLISLRRKSDI